MFGIVAEPNKQLMTKMGMANPGYLMEDIAEESSSIGSSIPGTPQIKSEREATQNEQQTGTVSSQEEHSQTTSLTLKLDTQLQGESVLN